jgi:hypothetical protein
MVSRLHVLAQSTVVIVSVRLVILPSAASTAAVQSSIGITTEGNIDDCPMPPTLAIE